MTDPAVEAARRACKALKVPSGGAWEQPRIAQAAAREMAKPIRDWYERTARKGILSDHDLVELARLIFTSEELG